MKKEYTLKANPIQILYVYVFMSQTWKILLANQEPNKISFYKETNQCLKYNNHNSK